MGDTPTIRTLAQIAGGVENHGFSGLARSSAHPAGSAAAHPASRRGSRVRPNALVANLLPQLRVSKTSKYQSTLGLLCVAKDPSELETVPTFRAWIAGCRARATEQGYGFDRLSLYKPDVTSARLVKILDARNIRGLAVAGFYEGEALSKVV